MTDIALPAAAEPFLRFASDPLHGLETPPQFVELLPIAIYACDRRGRILWFNQKAVELWGRAPTALPDSELYCGFFKSYVDGREISREASHMARVLRSGVAIHGLECVLEREDGSRVWVMMHIDPVRDDSGNVVGAINCFHDISANKKIEQTLREQDQRLAATYEHANIGIGEVDRDGRLLRVNQTACAITGRAREQLLGENIFDWRRSDQHDEDRRQFEALIDGRIDRYVIDKRYRRGDGSAMWMHVICSAVRDEAGEFLFAVRVFQDVTEAKRAIEALAESEQRLAASYEHAAIAISEVDAEGRLLRVNETVCAITGYSREELLGRSVFDVSHPDDRAEDRESFRSQTVGQAPPYAVEKRLICKDGRIIWVSVASSSVYDQAGRFRYGIRVMQDITARRRAEQQARDSEQQLLQLLEALPAAVYTTDAAGRITFYNQAAVELSGRVPKLYSDEWCVTWKLYYPDGRPMRHDECPMAVALRENRQVRGCEAVAERPDGSRVPFMPYPTPLHDGSGALIGAVNMLVDITERKRAEDRQKALIDELNHRVKNTLATVQSLAMQTLRQSGGLGDVLMARLFALSCTHDQLSRAGWESADLKSIVDAVLAPYRMHDDGRIGIEGDPVKLPPNCALLLAMVIHELSTNAVKYGSLSVSEGVLRLAWRLERRLTDQVLHIEWAESGGPPVRRPTRRGFGSRLADRAITRELGGSAEMDFHPSGFRCKFAIPLANFAA